MREELDRLLCDRYPALFADRHLPPTESAMGRGFECDDGWFDLIDALCCSMQWSIAHCGVPPVRVNQVKEKMGSLRVHYQGGNDVTRGMKVMAENMLVRLCEVCGHPGMLLQNRRYTRTLCEKHARLP